MSLVTWTTADKAFDDYWQQVCSARPFQKPDNAVREAFSFGAEAASHFAKAGWAKQSQSGVPS